MRISDWSSDVCSSDLWIAHRAGAPGGKAGEGELDVARSKIKCRGVEPAAHVADVPVRSHADFDVGDLLGAEELLLGESRPQGRGVDAATAVAAPGGGIEEQVGRRLPIEAEGPGRRTALRAEDASGPGQEQGVGGGAFVGRDLIGRFELADAEAGAIFVPGVADAGIHLQALDEPVEMGREVAEERAASFGYQLIDRNTVG